MASVSKMKIPNSENTQNRYKIIFYIKFEMVVNQFVYSALYGIVNNGLKQAYKTLIIYNKRIEGKCIHGIYNRKEIFYQRNNKSWV